MLARYKLERNTEQSISEKFSKKKTVNTKSKSKKHTQSSGFKKRNAEFSFNKKKLKEKWQGSKSKVNKPEAASPVERLVSAEDVVCPPTTLSLPREPLSLNLSDRPIRAAAATAQAISEAQQEFLSLEPPPEFKRNKRGEIEVLVDKPIKTRKYCRKAKLVSNETPSTESDREILLDEEEISKYVSDMMESFKTQFLTMLDTMQDPLFRRNVEKQLTREQRRHEELALRAGQLESQIEVLVQESLEMLKFVLKELGIEVQTPSEFIEKAKEIVCNHNDLQSKRMIIESEIQKLQEEQRQILKEKEKQLFESVLLQRASLHGNLSEQDILRMVQAELRSCTKADTFQKTDNLLLDVTLTRVARLNTNINDRNNNNCEQIRTISFPKLDLEDSNTESTTELVNKSKNLAEPREKQNSHVHPNSAVLDHINREIERNMRQTEMLPRIGKVSNPVSRLEQVIEDSVRGSSPSPTADLITSQNDSGSYQEKDHEGLASRLQTCKSKDVPKNVENKKTPRKIGSSSPQTQCGDQEDERQWQEEMSSGFDRLLALASQVDPRRRSVDVNTESSQPNTSTVGTNAVEASQPPSGEKLPERHFKKRYFDQERLQQQKQMKNM